MLHNSRLILGLMKMLVYNLTQPEQLAAEVCKHQVASGLINSQTLCNLMKPRDLS